MVSDFGTLFIATCLCSAYSKLYPQCSSCVTLVYVKAHKCLMALLQPRVRFQRLYKGEANSTCFRTSLPSSIQIHRRHHTTPSPHVSKHNTVTLPPIPCCHGHANHQRSSHVSTDMAHFPHPSHLIMPTHTVPACSLHLAHVHTADEPCSHTRRSCRSRRGAACSRRVSNAPDRHVSR